MRIILVAVFMCFATLASAATTVCVAEKGAIVSDNNKVVTYAGEADVSNDKWILSDESGSWRLKKVGQEYAFFDNCVNKHYCENSSGFAGVFIHTHGIFTVVYLSKSASDENHLVSEKGRCTDI